MVGWRGTSSMVPTQIIISTFSIVVFLGWNMEDNGPTMPRGGLEARHFHLRLQACAHPPVLLPSVRGGKAYAVRCASHCSRVHKPLHSTAVIAVSLLPHPFLDVGRSHRQLRTSLRPPRSSLLPPHDRHGPFLSRSPQLQPLARILSKLPSDLP